MRGSGGKSPHQRLEANGGLEVESIFQLKQHIFYQVLNCFKLLLKKNASGFWQ